MNLAAWSHSAISAYGDVYYCGRCGNENRNSKDLLLPSREEVLVGDLGFVQVNELRTSEVLCQSIESVHIDSNAL